MPHDVIPTTTDLPLMVATIGPENVDPECITTSSVVLLKPPIDAKMFVMVLCSLTQKGKLNRVCELLKLSLVSSLLQSLYWQHLMFSQLLGEGTFSSFWSLTYVLRYGIVTKISLYILCMTAR